MTDFEQQVAEALDDLGDEAGRYSSVERGVIRDFLKLRAPRVAAALEVLIQAYRTTLVAPAPVRTGIRDVYTGFGLRDAALVALRGTSGETP